GMLTISNNIYFLGPNSGTPTFLRRGIYVDNVISSNANLNISGNSIDGTRIGIRVRNISDGTVTQNQIYPQTTGGTVNKFGIYLTRCARSRVIQNNILRTVSIPIQRIEAMRGIRIDGCQGSLILSNTTLGMGKGHYCFGNNSDTYYYCNIMDNCIEGIFMEAATLPDQGAATTTPSDNQWINMGSNLRVIETSPTGNFFTWYHRGIFNNPLNDFSPGPWIVSVINSIQTTGDGPCGLPNGQDPPKSREQSFGNIVMDSTQYSWLVNENKYFDKNFLLSTINNDSTFIDQGLPYDMFYELFKLNNEESNYSYFEQIETLTNNGNIFSAFAMNQAIVDTNLIEFNKKQILNSYLQSFAVGDSSLDSTQISNLELIAWQSLAEGGEGVSMARSMLHLEIDDEYGSTFRNTQADLNNENLKFDCYPNPVSNNILIVRSLDNSKIYQLFVASLTGEILISENFSSKNYILKLRDLSSGSYLLKITDRNKIVFSTNIIKI
nr:T9SS type A sorting domain-containing protein [Nitrosopumilus sp.]